MSKLEHLSIFLVCLIFLGYVEWSQWSICSVSCNHGIQSRWREAKWEDLGNVITIPQYQTRECNTFPCPQYSKKILQIVAFLNWLVTKAYKNSCNNFWPRDAGVPRYSEKLVFYNFKVLRVTDFKISIEWLLKTGDSWRNISLFIGLLFLIEKKYCQCVCCVQFQLNLKSLVFFQAV